MARVISLVLVGSFFIQSLALLAAEPPRPEPRTLVGASYEWLKARWHAPEREDYVHAATLATINAIGYTGTALVFGLDWLTALMISTYQVLITFTDASTLRFQDNVFQNRPVGGIARTMKSVEIPLRMLKQLTIAEGFRFISGPVLGAQAFNTWGGQSEILWNVLALGTSQSLIDMARGRYISTAAASRFTNMLRFALVGGLGTLDILGVHFFDIPHVSNTGVHGSNLLIWATGLSTAFAIAHFPNAFEAGARRYDRITRKLSYSCRAILGRVRK